VGKLVQVPAKQQLNIFNDLIGMVRFWNIVHYFAYRADFKFHTFFSKINPVLYIFKVPSIKKFYERKGVNIPQAVDEAFKRPDIGISNIRAGAVMHGLIFLICLGMANLYYAFFKPFEYPKPIELIFFLIISIIVDYFLLFKHKKYLGYFKKFEKMSRKEWKRCIWISSGTIIGILLFFVGSFILFIHNKH